MRNTAPVQNNISADDWYTHFKCVLNQQVNIDNTFKDRVESFNAEHNLQCDRCIYNDANQDALNDYISQQEIVKSIESISNGKAPAWYCYRNVESRQKR